MLLLFTVFCSLRLQFSRLGRAWIAIREDETAAAAMGVPLMRTKTWAYASGAFFGGVAGAFYASFKSATFPGDFYFNISVFILCMVILGGMGNIWGVLVGAAFLAYLNVFGLANTGAVDQREHPLRVVTARTIDVPLYASGIYGAIILLVMLFRPEGPDPLETQGRRVARGRPRRAALRHPACRRAGRVGRRSPRHRRIRDVLVAERGLRKEFGGLVAVNDVDFTVPRGKVVVADRPERRRQDDVLQHAHRRLQADRRARSRSSARTSPASRLTRSPSAGSAAPSRTSASSRT